MSDDGTEGQERGTRRTLRDVARPGVIGSLALHVAVLSLLFYQVGIPPVLVSIIPVEVVQLAEQTTAAAPPEAAAPPSAGSSPQVASAAPPPAVRQPRVPQPAPAQPVVPPSTPRPASDALPPAPQDALQSQLEALAKLRMPNNAGAGAAASGSNAPSGARSGYRVEDLIRAQVQRRWNLRLDELGERNLIVTIHVVLEPDGTVTMAEIVDTPRTTADSLYRSIAISARNAVLLSSPLTLPAGMTAEMRDMTISFNTRDSLR